ncbi:MAG: trypsin-like peptidase domain-containing protein [Chthoniobacteraceae bacterium]
MKNWISMIIRTAGMMLAVCTANAQFVPNDEVELVRDEPLIFNASVYRQGRKGERFHVADYRVATRKIFLLATDSKGRTFALNVPDSAVAMVGKDPSILSEQAFVALRTGQFEEAQKLMFQVSLLDRERDVCLEISTHLGRLAEAMQSYQLLIRQQGQVNAEIKRLQKNADLADRPNRLVPSDTSGQMRAQQIRREADQLAANARASMEDKQGVLVSELKLLEQLAIKRLTAGAFGEALDINEMVMAYASRRMQGMATVNFSQNAALIAVKTKAAEAQHHLEDAHRHVKAKNLHAAQKAVAAGLACEPGSYSMRRMQGELSTRLENAGKAYATAVAYHQLKRYDDALKALEKVRSECGDHEATEDLSVTLKSILTEKDSRMAKAKVAEEAGNYAEAWETYETYAQDGDIRRIIPLYAKQRESDGDFLFAYFLYEKAGQPAQMQRLQPMKDQQLTEYAKARILLVEAKFSDALAIYRRYKDARMERDAVKQQGAFLESQGKFDDAVAIYKDAKLAGEVVRVKEFVSTRETLIVQGKQQEQAASYDSAIDLFRKANAAEDVRRVATAAARSNESKKDYHSAAEYYEIAGMFEDAGRIRREHDVTASVRKLTDQEIFKRCAPACVTVLGEAGLGSGFFVKKGGYVLTNHHVVEGATRIKIRTAANLEYEARVIQLSKTPDIALLKAELNEHPVLKIANSDTVETGATASTIGSPKGRTQSFTKGNISNNDRLFRGNKCFQISVLINHGNSGGPLLDEMGQVIGICTFGLGTATVLNDGTNIGSDIQGINYAIKINEARRVFKDTPAF